MAIPILWQNPFSFYQKSLFISEYFSSLDEDEEYILKEYGMNLKIFRKLFNYEKAREWTKLNLVKPISSKTYFDALMAIVINLLLKLLFESGTVLHELDLSLQHLSLSVMPGFNIENITIFLKVLAKHIMTISSLDLVIYSGFEPRLFHSLSLAIICIIKSQEQLKLFSLDGGNYRTEFYEFEVLKDCKTLETLRIRDCSSKLLNLLDCKISTLEVFDCPIDVQTILLILKNSGLLLQQLSFEPDTLDDNIHEFSIQLLELIGNLHKLQFLSLRRRMATIYGHSPQSLQCTFKKTVNLSP
ncbi:hypothetical protein C2G38_2170401 [Gigaspora rosea]|uniref:F-box domain-containing protein n=1 Tax=Gigaspora rosea TaxID=44941 RepID=A0A397VMN2_9GLOM|nr:hypothetical protein C2G38_2170401 [Gigaspora rosea]